MPRANQRQPQEWDFLRYERYKEQLVQEQEEEYRKFSAKLLPEVPFEKIQGVRLPKLRKIASVIAKEDQEEYLKFFEQHILPADNYSMEEFLIYGFVIGHFKNFEQAREHIFYYAANIDNWSTCDSFCTSLKFVRKERSLVYDALQEYLNSAKEFEIRFALVMLLDYYVDDEYLERVLECICRVKNTCYYVQMAQAWVMSMCYLQNRERTLEVLQNGGFDRFTYNKSLQKMMESLRVSKEERSYLKGLKRK